MAEIVARLEDLKRLDESVHWFCPRGFSDYGCYFDEDCLDTLQTETEQEKLARLEKVKEAEIRRNDALEACKILAFDGSDADGYKRELKAGLAQQLVRCEVCVREYHRSRSLLQLSLEAEYATEEVRAFLDKFDRMNILRIGLGLNSMTESLMDLPPDKRSITAAGDVGMYALFEALNCGPFLQDEEALQQYFDTPFRLVQQKKKIKLPNYTPGMTVFLFSRDDLRLSWALRNFAGVKRPLTATEFEHSVKPYLEQAMGRVNVLSLQYEFLATFWKGARLIISKLTKDLMTNHLRTIEGNIYTLALELFQIDSAHFSDMIACYQTLLEVSPSDFWAAMNHISAQHVAETILRSPVLDRMLTITNESEPLNLEEKLNWALPFVRSIKPANLVPPIRTLLDQFLHKFQEAAYSKYGNSVCWSVGLECLLEAVKRVKLLNGGPVVIHLIEVVAKDHIAVIMQELEGIEKKEEMAIERTEQLALDIIEAVLALDVQSLAHGREVLLKTKSLQYEIGVSSLEVWKFTMRVLKPGHAALATAVISGVAGLLPLEMFTTRQKQQSPKQTEAWNSALKRTLNYVQGDLLDRLDHFSPEQLVELYQEQKAALGLMALLFSGERHIHQGTLDVFKNLSGEDNRRGSMMHLIQVFFTTTLSAVSNAQNVICKSGIFAPCSIFIKLSTDVLGCLCDSQDGVLRSKHVSEEQEVKALEMFWETTWKTLESIFRNTEPWSNLGYDKQMMQDFCRETMDFADYVFDQYSIIAHTLQAAQQGSGNAKQVGQALLKFPTEAFTHITKWLRLRDEYLIAKAVGLTSKILIRLQEVGIKIDKKASQYIEDVVTSTEKNAKVRTKISMNQKAQLQRALEKHLGESLTDVIDVDAFSSKKQGTLTGWAASGSGRSTPVPSAKPKGVIDVDAWSAKSDSDREKRRLADEHDRAYADLIAGASKGSEAYRQMQAKKSATPATVKAAQKHQDDQKNFLVKRKQEKEAAEKRKAEALAKQKLGVGSGVAGLGDMGKDHSLKGQNVMVSSDEESDDDDDLDDDLFGGKNKLQKKKIERPNVNPNGALGLRPEVKKGPVRIQRTSRSLKDMRARLAPDLQPLHKVILKWDFFHNGDYPPGASEHIFRPVANAYQDPTTYQETFEPLLTLEAWQGMIRSREENTAKPYEVKVTNRSNVDNFIEFSSLVGHADNRELSLQEGDIILLSKAKKPSEDPSAPHCLARICKMKRQKAHIEVVYQLMPGTSLAPSLTMQAVVFGLKISTITPLEREYGALQGLQYYDLCQQIIKAAPSRRINFSEKQIAAFQDVYNVNRAQSEAINAALENEGFSLIQGPPGSGKTKTIVAIVGGLLSQTLGGSTNGATRISMPRANGNQSAGGDATAKKLLVCAPSNAAVDEIVMRLKQGVKSRSGRHHMLNLVRIGRSDAINTQVVDVTMDELVAKRLGGNGKDDSRAKNAELFKEHEKVSATLRELYQKRDGGELKGKELTNLDNEIVSVRKRKNEMGVRIDNVKDQERNAGREAELNRKRAQQAVLDDAHVICATLSGSGHDMFQALNIEFETVIIDEAAQCVEMSSLIPLKYGCVKCIMVGDPKQLPPTVFSKEAAKFQYEQSLFVRMQNNFADEVHLLDTQYRMHPEISAFPSRTFYDGLLKDGEGMAGLRQQPWHTSALLAPYRFFDVHGHHQSAPKGHSLINIAEIEVAMALFERLTNDFSNYEFNGRIGIITPYKSQLRMLKDRFSQRFGNAIFDMVEFNTTDAFQGRESEIIIFSCVRASPAGGIGFLQDIRRMNVGLTRAKSSLWVLGNSESLMRGQFWRKLVEDAKARDAYTTGDLMSMLRKPSSAFPASSAKTQSMYDVGSHMPQMDGGNSSLTVSTIGSRRPSGGAPNTADPRKSAAPVPSKPVQDDTGKMEGVRYRFEDRVPKKRPAAAESGSDRKSGAHPSADRMSAAEDVEMEDAASAASGTATPHSGAVPSLDGARSRAETPLSAASGGEEKAANRADGSVKPRPASVAPAVPPAMLKKRPAASPFIPKTKPRR
ncbi:hypothetical protein LTR36_010153 [Oleoguttula mirabilis]|uniref:Uncharacterized protein n=1 Tax=Oleoguttula mirabilis TaxID=1507867 RepID=A0AAV9JRP6_9PEZI|nr:hypothetical protein LTR36_010153 [Oleoguttula mirabilis]